MSCITENDSINTALVIFYPKFEALIWENSVLN